jgi:ubiquinone/menaquinone biosynthesis C-methylase UbiE
MSERFEPTERPEVKNAFGLPIYEIKDVLVDREIEAVIQQMRRDVFRHLGMTDEKSDAVMKECLDFARSYGDVTEYEQSAHAVLAREGITEAIPEKLVERARIMHGQIKPHLLAGSVLDLGCGDARLAQMLQQDGFTPQLADVYENPNVASTGMPFQLLGQSETVPFGDSQFDNTLLLTVLHHSDNPEQVLREAQRVTRPDGRVIVIESVYGVNGQELSPARRAQVQKYLALTPEQQRRVNIFFDHFYNRVIHYTDDPSKKVNVPFNFNTPDIWKQLFEQAGLKQEQIVHLGVDQPAVPEYHTLHVLSVTK